MILLLLLLLYDMGVRDFNELQIMTDIHPRTLYRNLTKLREGQTLERRPGSGRPKTFWGDNKRSLTLLARNNLEFSAKDPKQAVASKGGPSASIRTIQSLRDSGYTKKRAKKTLISVSQMEKRLEFSLQMNGFLWDNVLITDECLFYVHRNTIKYWAKGKDKPHKKLAKFSPSIMVWGLCPTKGFT